MGKRRISKNIWGNWVGYTGRHRTHEFGEDALFADFWLRTGIFDKNAAYSEY